MIEIAYKLPSEFFQEEIRSGYHISRQMKEVWAVELDLLVEAQRVFEKYGVRWYAIGGTLFGGGKTQRFYSMG